MLKMLTTGGLARSSEKRGVTTNLFSWESFLKEFMLDVEVSHFYIFKKRRLLVRFGSWDNAVHPKKKPAEIWSASLKNSLKLPRLRISSLLKDVAAKVGEIASITQAAFETESDEGQESDSGVGSDSNNDSESESSVDLESEHRSGSDQGDSELVGLLVNTNIPDASLFPLLHSLCIDSDSKMDCLIQEIIKFHGAKTVKFTSRNNRPGSLLIMPCLRNIKRYDNEFSKKGSMIEFLVHHIVEHSNCNPSEAAECLIRGFYKKFEDSFATVAIQKGVTPIKRKMDEATVEAMLCEASINTANARILFRHLNQFFGHSYFASEQKRRSYFGDSDYPPTVDKEVLPDKTIIPFWYKEPHLLLQHQVNVIIKPEDLGDLKRVDLAVGGDSGGGFFRTMLKDLFRFNSKQSTSRIFQIASVSYSKDDIEVFKKTVLDAIGNSLKLIVEGGYFSVYHSQGTDNMKLSFSSSNQEDQALCSVPVRLFKVGDLKYYMQMLGRDGMSSCWCVWCASHPSYWKSYCTEPDSIPPEEKEPWTIETMAAHHEMIEQENVREARQRKGIVGKVIWDFIEPKDYIFPVLHFEIGAVNNVLDSFYGFVEDRVELLSQEEKVLRSSVIIAEVALTEAQKANNAWKDTGGINLAMQRIQKTNLVAYLKRKTLTVDERHDLTQQKTELDAIITSLITQRKELEKQATERRKGFQEAKAALKKMRDKKSKSEKSLIAEIENLLIQHNITAASYHGGKLHGVDCRELIRLSKDLFPAIEQILLTSNHPDVCDSFTIETTCELYRDLFVTLDTISSKLRIKHGEVKEDDVTILEEAMVNLDYLWGKTDLSFTPKIHSAIAHAIEQVKRLGGIGDVLEDDLEHLHQTSAKITSCVSRMKNKDQQAFVHSKIEAKHNNIEVRERVQDSKQSSKRQFKKRNMELDSTVRALRAKKERDDSRVNTLQFVQRKVHFTLQKRHDIDREEYLQSKEGEGEEEEDSDDA